MRCAVNMLAMYAQVTGLAPGVKPVGHRGAWFRVRTTGVRSAADPVFPSWAVGSHESSVLTRDSAPGPAGTSLGPAARSPDCSATGPQIALERSSCKDAGYRRK